MESILPSLINVHYPHITTFHHVLP